MIATFNTQVEVAQDEESWVARLVRLDGDKRATITTIRGLTPADVYHKFGIKLPEPTPVPEDALEAAKHTLRLALDNLPKSKVISYDTVVDILLDTQSHLGYTTTTEGES